MAIYKKLLAFLLCGAIVAYAQGNSFKRVRYNGGSVPSKVKQDDWNNRLTVTAEAITLELNDGQKLVIPPKSVTSLSYGQEAHRRVGTMVALAVLVAPVALFGLFHKTRLHYIGIQYTNPQGRNDGILLQGDKDDYRAMLVALQGVTSVPVSVGEKEREFVPVGVTTTVVKGASETKQASESSKAAVSDASTGSIAITTAPEGADVLVDDNFYGNSPVTLKLKPGKHKITVRMSGYKDWSRDVTTDAGADARLNANLDKLDEAQNPANSSTAK